MGATFHSFCFCHLGSCREVLTGSWFAQNKIMLRDFVLYVCNRHRWLHPWASDKFTTKFSPLLWAVWELSRCGRCTAPSREPSAYHILRELRLLFFLDAVCPIYDYCSALTPKLPELMYWISFKQEVAWYVSNRAFKLKPSAVAMITWNLPGLYCVFDLNTV